MGFIKGLISRISEKPFEPPASQPGRNQPCWCGSGKKYKRCHFEKDRDALSRKAAACCTTST